MSDWEDPHVPGHIRGALAAEHQQAAIDFWRALADDLAARLARLVRKDGVRLLPDEDDDIVLARYREARQR